MAASKSIDRICAVALALTLAATVLFMNGESLGLRRVVDEDAEAYSDSVYFTAQDQNGEWDDSGATVITLNGSSAAVSGSGAYAYDGGVVISGGGYYVLSGTLTDGSITVDAYRSSKVWIKLDGVTVSCSDDACLRVDQADKVFLTLADGTENSFTSGAGYSDAALADGTDGAVFAHDDLTINGGGSLTVTAAYRHGIAANDDLVITGGTLVVDAQADAIHANDSLRIKDADITVTAQDDGVVVSNEGGFLYVESGIVRITSADDGIHTAGDITIAGGTFEIAAGDDGIHSDTAIAISDGGLLISECYEGIEAVTIDISGGDITIYPSDDGLNANGGGGMMGGGMMGGGFGGGQRPGRGGSSDGGETDGAAPNTGETGDPPDMSDGEQSGEAPGTGETGGTPGLPGGAEGSGGEAPAADASGGSDEETYIRISGGTLTIVNETGRDADGLDSNGDVYITGGTIRVSLLGDGSNSAIDYGSENGGVCEISGGTVVACGGSSMAEGFDESSTQCGVLYNLTSTMAAGTPIVVRDNGGGELLSYEPPCSFSSVAFSCPELTAGGTYTIQVGDESTEFTLTSMATTLGESSGMGGGFGGMGGGFGGMGGGFGDGTGEGMTPPDWSGSDDGERPTPPDWDGSDGEAPDRSEMGEAPDRPDGELPDGNGTGAQSEQAAGSDAADGTETESAAVSTEAWLLLGASLVVLLAGLLVAIKFKRY